MASSATRFILFPSHLDSGVRVPGSGLKSCAADHVDESKLLGGAGVILLNGLDDGI